MWVSPSVRSGTRTCKYSYRTTESVKLQTDMTQKVSLKKAAAGWALRARFPKAQMGQGQSLESLGAVTCHQSLFTCSNIGIDNVPAFGMQAPKSAGSSAALGKGNTPAPAAPEVPAGDCLQYCIPVQNSLAIMKPLHAKLGYCCSSGFNNFQGSIRELVPGMTDIAVWQYDHGESPF